MAQGLNYGERWNTSPAPLTKGMDLKKRIQVESRCNEEIASRPEEHRSLAMTKSITPEWMRMILGDALRARNTLAYLTDTG